MTSSYNLIDWTRSAPIHGDWIDYLYAFHLFQMGFNDDNLLKLNISEIEARVISQLPIWICRPTERALNRAVDGPFAFKKNINGREWLFQDKSTSLVTVQFKGCGENFALSVEIKGQRKDFRHHPPEIISISAEVLELNHLHDYELRRIYLRLLHVEGTARRGILLPKDHQWKVIPTALSLDPSYKAYEQTGQMTMIEMSLDNFVSKSSY